LQNDLTGKYSINDKMTLNLTARYYWSYSDNQAFFTLQDDGALSQNSTYLNRNRNFNSWNLDLSYSWWFAPARNCQSYTATMLKKAVAMLKED
jgi:hypothetical protein